MLEKLLEKSSQLFNKPGLILVTSILVTVILLLFIPALPVDNDIANMMPKNNIDRIVYDKYEEVFGNSSLIYIGLEAENIYNKDILEYIRFLEQKIKEYNKILPIEFMTELLDLPRDKAEIVINVISESGMLDTVELQKILTDKQRLVNEYFLDEKDAELISSRVSHVSFPKLLDAYAVPFKDIITIANVDYIQGEGDKFIVKKLLDNGPITEESLSLLKKRIESWSFYQGAVISDDHSLTPVLLQLTKFKNHYRRQIYNKVFQMINQTKPKNIKIYFSGEPVISDSISEYMMRDISFLLPLVTLVIIFTLYLSFQNWAGVFYPLLAVLISVIWTVGTMSLVRIPMNMISTIMPVILIATGSAYGIHFMNNYFLDKEKDKLKSIKGNIAGVGLAILMAALTTFAGFFSLLTTNFIPIRDFGIFTAIGVLYALVIVIYLIPALLLISKKQKTVLIEEESQNKWILQVLKAINVFIQNQYKGIITSVIIISILCIYGLTLIKVEMNTVTFFKKNAMIRKADNVLNKKLTGTQVLNIIIESKNDQIVATPEVLKEVDRFSADILKTLHGKVTKVLSISEYLKKMNQEMYSHNAAYYKIPETKEKINDYLLLYSGNLDSYITPDKDKIKIILTTQRSSTTELITIKNYCRKYFTKSFLDQNNLNLVITGAANMYIVINKLIVNGQISSLIMSLLVVFLINLFVFRKAVISLISLIPIFYSLLINFAVMGFFNIPLNAGTAMVASIAIGIGIDYAIHFIVRYRKDLQVYKENDQALAQTINHTGLGIFYNVFSVTAGFLVLTFSQFVPLIQFGFLVSLNMLSAGSGALIIIPAVLKVVNKKYISEIIE